MWLCYLLLNQLCHFKLVIILIKELIPNMWVDSQYIVFEKDSVGYPYVILIQ